MVRQDTAEKGFTGASGTDQNQIEVLDQPLSLGPFEELRFLQATRNVKVNIRDGRPDEELRLFEPPL